MTATTLASRRYVPRGAALEVFHRREAEVLLSGPAGTGKAQPLDATVHTLTGPVRMGDLAIGDLVLTPDGSTAPIVAIPFRGTAPVYRVTLSDGTTVDCSDGHLWDVSWCDTSERQHRAVLPLIEMLRLGLRRRAGTRPKYWIPQTEPVGYAERPVPVPPYTLGALLGDGYLRPGEVSFTSADPEIAQRVAAELEPRYRLAVTPKPGNAAACYRIVPAGWRTRRPSRAKPGYVSRTSSGKWMARVRLPDQPTGARYLGSFDTPAEAQVAILNVAQDAFSDLERTGDSIHAALDALGLRNSRSATKFVPDVYKFNAPAVRLAVLRGLMDTDGYAERSTVSFTSISAQLAADVRWLVESLGGTARISTKQPTGGQVAYAVWIRLPEPAEAFALQRKRDRAVGRQVPVRRWIESVELRGEQECQCITIGSEDGLYLTERFVVTHNSRACLEKLHMLCLLNPGMRGLIVRKTLASLGSTALVTWREHVVKEALDAGVLKFYGGSPQHSAQYTYGNGSVIVVGGLDRSSRIMSSEYDVVYVQEAIELTENDWEAILTRLRNGKVSFQQVVADTNPDVPTHWLNQRCQRGQTVQLESRHEDNPILFGEDKEITARGAAYMAKLDALTGVRYQRLRRGLWVAAEGIIYDGWDPQVHVVDRFDVPDDWTRWWSVDFGYVHPFVWQCWAEDPDGRLFLEREIFHTKRLVEDHAKQILKVTEGMPRPRTLITDHDAEGRATLEKHLGMSSTAAHKAVTEGIQAVQQRLKLAGDGRPRIFLMRDALVERDADLDDAKAPCSTAEEVPGYVWDTGVGKKPKETPVKERDDGCDALRYVVAQRDLGSRPGIRWM